MAPTTKKGTPSKAAAAKAALSPTGLPLGPKGLYKIGRKLGEGAMSSVYEVVESETGHVTDWVAKVTPLPKKTTKKRTSHPETLNRILHAEYTTYESFFTQTQHLVPMLPLYGSKIPRTGNTTGLHDATIGNGRDVSYLVMERMAAEFMDVIPELVNIYKDQASIMLGPIAEQLINLMEGCHQAGVVLVDVKPANIMLAHTTDEHKPRTKNKKTTTTSSSSLDLTTQLADRIRLIDLGSAQPWASLAGKGANDRLGDLAGTPLYASLHGHDLQSSARRDDAESFVYVLGELVIRLATHLDGTSFLYEETATPSYLPWSQENSDGAVGAVKKQNVEDVNSAFYQRMGQGKAAMVIKELLDEIWTYRFKQEPDYDTLRELASSLSLPNTRTTSAKKKTKRASTQSTVATRKATPAKKKAPPRLAATAANSDEQRRSTRATQRAAAAADTASTSLVKRPSSRYYFSENDEEDESPAKKTAKTINVDSDDDCVMEDVDSKPKAKKGARRRATRATRAVAEMDVEESEDEAADVDMDVKPAATKKIDDIGLALDFIQGPYKGSSIPMLGGVNEIVVMGSKPRKTKNVTVFCTAADPLTDKSHVRVELHMCGAYCKVTVRDLGSEKGTFFKDESLVPNKDQVLFSCQSIRFGANIVRFRKLTPKEVETGRSGTQSSAAARGTSRSTPVRASGKKSAPKTEVENVENVRLSATKKGNLKKAAPDAATLALTVTKGMYKGEQFILEEGTPMFVGANPPGKNGQCVMTLEDDESIDDTHAQLELRVSKRGGTQIKVKDLNSQAGTWIGKQKIARGKEGTAFPRDSVRFGETTTIKLEPTS